jgi:branched-chain amino acid transport system ATP-binding protein
MMTTPTPLLECLDLHAFHGSRHVLRGVDVAIGAGEVVGLLGRNGMGKTTLIRTLLGHVRAARGTVRVRGIGCTGAPPHEIARQGIAYVPEGRGVFPNLTVRENLLMAARPSNDRRREWTLERALALFPRLAARLRHRGQQLSGGEQQMLAIGRALLTNPDLLVLDEATEGLAPLVAAETWNVLAALRRSGMATLIVDRNYRLVLEHTDRCVVIEKGRVVLADSSPALRPEQLTAFLGV